MAQICQNLSNQSKEKINRKNKKTMNAVKRQESTAKRDL